jgi:hypothetical protein
MWYVLYQQAQQILADREAQADQVRLARLVEGQRDARRLGSVFASARRQVARVTLFVGRSATRLAGEIDADVARAA